MADITLAGKMRLKYIYGDGRNTRVIMMAVREL